MWPRRPPSSPALLPRSTEGEGSQIFDDGLPTIYRMTQRAKKLLRRGVVLWSETHLRIPIPWLAKQQNYGLASILFLETQRRRVHTGCLSLLRSMRLGGADRGASRMERIANCPAFLFAIVRVIRGQSLYTTRPTLDAGHLLLGSPASVAP